MTTMTSSDDKEVPSTGLGHSTPLVTVQASAAHGTGIRPPSAPVGLSGARRVPPTTTTTNHPLAVPPTTETTTESQKVPLPPPPKVVTPTVAALPASSQAPPSTPTKPTTTASPLRTPPALTPPPLKAPPSTTSLDALADAFLSGPSARTVDNEQSPLLRPPPLPQEEGLQRLRTLVERRAWGDVLQVTGSMLRTPSSPHGALYASLVESSEETPPPPEEKSDSSLAQLQQETVEIISLELTAWLKLRRYADLGREIERWNFVSFNNPAAVSPSWIPWSLHIMAAETFQYTDPDSKRCIDVLNTMRNEILKEKDYEMWLACIDHALTNAFVRVDEYRLALIALDNLFETLPTATDHVADSRFAHSKEERSYACSTLLSSFRCEVLSRQGRIMLQAGALVEASTLFEEARSEWNAYKASTAITPRVSEQSRMRVDEYLGSHDVQAQIFVNDGTLCFAHADYDKAMSLFSSAVDQLRSRNKSHRGLDSTYRGEDWMGGITIIGRDSNRTLMTDACNNMSLCALYTCRMQDAVRMIESLIREDPTAFFTEGLAFNLSTLYELGSDQPSCTRKKRVVQLIAKRFYLHDIGPEAFRLS